MALGFTQITAMTIPVEIHVTNACPFVSTPEAQITDTVLSTGNVVLENALNKPPGQNSSPTHTFALTIDAHNAQIHASKTSVSAKTTFHAKSADAPTVPTQATQSYTVKYTHVPWYPDAPIRQSASLMASVTARSTSPAALYVAVGDYAWSGQTDSSLLIAMNTLYARGLGRVARSPGQEPTFAPRTNVAWKVVRGKRRVNRTIVSNIPASVAVAHKLCGTLRALRHVSALHMSVRWTPALPRRRRSMDIA